jgi:hypothetical protein
MPAINVSRTDTFEQQRLKINQIGEQIFNVTAGGSDLSTGNLKLGDGIVTAPSLAFVSDATLGLYKPQNSSLGFVSASKKLLDLNLDSVVSYQDFIVQQRKLVQNGFSVISNGSNYDEGTYTDIPVIGGTGQNATFDIEVIAWNGSITNVGSNYLAGQFLTVDLVGGSGTGATCNFDVDGIGGTITDAGSAYAPGTYTNVPITGGSGTGAKATIGIQGSAQISGSITNPGTGYTDNTYGFVQAFNEPIQTFIVISIPNPQAGQPGQPNYIYQIDGNAQPLLTMVAGNTYRFDMSDPSLDPSAGVDGSANHRMTFQMADGSGIDPEFEFYLKGSIGFPGAFQDLIIKPTAATGTNVIRYDCANHPNMAPAGGNITVNTGTTGQYGSQAYLSLTVSGNSVTSISFVSNGSGYQVGDILQVSNIDMGGSGTGFEYTISGFVFNGVVSSVVFTDQGLDYEFGDVLSANDADLGNGGGSGFEFVVNTEPGLIQNFAVTARGTGYQVGDVFGLATGISNISTYLPGQTEPTSTTLTAGNPVISVANTAALQSGMNVSTSAGDTGQVDQTTKILSIDSSTQITLDVAPTVSGPANLIFTTPNLLQVTIPNTSGINIGDVVTKVSGVGILTSGTTVANVDDSTTITLSTQSVSPGPIVLNVFPPYGNPADDFSYTIATLGTVDSFTINNDGNGYSVDDLLTVNPTNLTQPINIPVTTKFVQTLTLVQTVSASVFSAGDQVESPAGEISNITTNSSPTVTPTVTGPLAATLTSGNPVVNLSSTSGISAGDFVSENSSGNLAVNTTVQSVDSATQITLSTAPLQNASVNLSFTSNETGSFIGITNISGGTGTGATFDVSRNAIGQVTSVTLNTGGLGYTNGDVITIPGTEVGGTSPTHDILLEVSSVSTSTPAEIISVQTSGGNITSLLVEANQGNPFASAQQLIKTGTSTPVYDIDTASAITIRYYIDPDGNGARLTPSFTLYTGSTYRFDLSDPSNSANQFSFSKFPDGAYSPSLVENIAVALDTSSRIATLTSTSGLVIGMLLSKVSGAGELDSDTRIESIDSATQITLSKLPLTSGATIVNFSGTVYTDGVTQGQNYLDIAITENTPSLYYYDANQYQDAGGYDGSEGVITIDPNNPKVFGSGFQVRVSNIQERDIISSEVLDGTFTAVKVVATEGEIDDVTSTTISTTTLGASTSVNTPTVVSSSALTLDATSIVCTNDFEVGLLTVDHTTGDLVTAGELQSSNRLNVNNKLFITDNIISTDASSDLILTAPTGRLTKVSGFAAITIPSGTTVQRPASATDGSIRFNTQTNQYEGYSSATSSWSSLGGVRDLDGNTTILAEEFVGANDNTLWFYNDNINTVKFTSTHLDFRYNKSIRSSSTTAPVFTNWTANTPVTSGQYLKYRNNLYLVTASGTTGTTGNEPIHTTGAVANGSAELTWSQLAVAPLTFEDIEVLRIGPLGGLPVSINNDLRLANNVISTDINDLVIRPNSGKKVVIDAPTTLVLPAGADADRGIPSQGSIRFSTTTSQFEGYDGTNWGSLGGVKDVNQNTYIIPELSPGSDEDILYFFNDNNNTLQLTTTSLDFYSVDTIRSVTSDELEITASLLTFDNGASTFDNTAVDRTFLSTTKQYFDLGLSAGLTTDPVLRLDDQGDVYLNIGFGTGVYNGVKVFDGDLKEFELADVRILTEKLTLVKGTSDNGNSVIYDTASDAGSKTTVLAVNPTTGDKEFFEFGIIDDGTDVFHTEYGNIRTGVQLIIPTFEVTGANTVRINITLGSGVNPTEAVNITVVSNITKK